MRGTLAIMRATACFYTLPADRASEVTRSAWPSIGIRVLGLFKSKSRRRQAWVDYLRAHARESGTVADGGGLLWDLERYLKDLGLPELKEWGERQVASAWASANTRSWVVVFDHAHAATAAERLGSVRPPVEGDVSRWEFYGRAAEETDFGLLAQRIEEVRQNLIARLERVGRDEIGVLDVPR